MRAIFGVGGRRLAAGLLRQPGTDFPGRAPSTSSGAGGKLFEGTVASLRHFRDDVREVATGLEGGLVLDGFSDFQEGDTIAVPTATEEV